MHEFIHEQTKDSSIDGFIARTLIQTDKGSVPINKIKVGHRVKPLQTPKFQNSKK